MARRKLARVFDLEKGTTRLAAVKSIDAALDLGNNINVTVYETELNLLRTKLNTYNTTLSTIDDLYNACLVQMLVVSREGGSPRDQEAGDPPVCVKRLWEH